MTLAIVIPCYNEEEVLRETASRILALLDRLAAAGKISDRSFVLFSNDGSRDATWEIVRELRAADPRVAGLNLAANVGHQNALMAGLEAATPFCDAAVSIDADLQDDIAVIEQMVDRFAEGCDIVYGVRNRRDTDTFFKRHTALAFYRLMSALGVRSVYNHADYRLMSRRALEQLARYGERNLFLRGIVPLIGYRTATVSYDRAERFAGESKYPLRKMVNFAIDGITSFSVKPLRMIAATGFVLLVVSLAALVYVLYSLAAGRAVEGWASIMLSVWFLGSLLLIAVGIVGEYVGKIYIEVKQRPRYNVERLLAPRNRDE